MDDQETRIEKKVAEYIVSCILRVFYVDWTPATDPLVDSLRLRRMTPNFKRILLAVNRFCISNGDSIIHETVQTLNAFEDEPVGEQRIFWLRYHLRHARLRIFSTQRPLEEKVLFIIVLVVLFCNWCLLSNQQQYVSEATKMIYFDLNTNFAGPIESTLSQIGNYGL